MKRAIIKDNSFVSKENLANIPNLKNKVLNQTLSQMENQGVFVFPGSMSTDNGLDKESMILASYKGGYFSGNLMGYLGCGDERLVIMSRFADSSNDFFSRYILKKVLDLPQMIDFDIDIKRSTNMYPLLQFVFPIYLKNAMRKGIFGIYAKKEYNDVNIKGKIDISRHIRINTPFVGNVAYSQRECNKENYLLQLIRHTIEYIKSAPHGSEILFKAKEEVALVIRTTPSYKHCDSQKIIMLNKKHPVRHPYYSEYGVLQNLCLSILQNEKHFVDIGVKHIYGLIFDISWLWEEYVNTIISEYFYHPINRKKLGGQKLFNNSRQVVYPDFLCRVNKHVVADAKYKPTKNIKSEDYLQILAYMFRFEAQKGILFYPKMPDKDEDKTYCLNSGITYEDDVVPRTDVIVIKYGLIIPQGVEDYEDYLKRIAFSESAFLAGIKQVLNDETSISH